MGRLGRKRYNILVVVLKEGSPNPMEQDLEAFWHQFLHFYLSNHLNICTGHPASVGDGARLYEKKREKSKKVTNSSWEMGWTQEESITKTHREQIDEPTIPSADIN